MKDDGTNTLAAPLNVFPTAGDDEGSFQVDGAMRRKGSAGHAIAVTGVWRADMRTCHFISYGRMRPTNHSTCSLFAIFSNFADDLEKSGHAPGNYRPSLLSRAIPMNNANSKPLHESRYRHQHPGICHAVETASSI